MYCCRLATRRLEQGRNAEAAGGTAAAPAAAGPRAGATNRLGIRLRRGLAVRRDGRGVWGGKQGGAVLQVNQLITD